MDAAALIAFRSAAQLELEAAFPASVDLPGYADPIPCAGGSLRRNNTKAILGGIAGDFAAAFRIRTELLTGPQPEVGSIIVADGVRLRIDRLTVPRSDVVTFIGANTPSKP